MKPHINTSNSQQQTQLRVYELLFKMARRIGIKIPESDYPGVNLSKVSYYNGKLNEINISENKIHSGDEIGEEIGHFLRVYLRRQKSQMIPRVLTRAYNFLKKTPKYHDKAEQLTDEFFGYLGRQILQDVTNRSDLLDFIGSPTQEDALDELKSIRKKKQELPIENKNLRRLKTRRRNILHHIRGYNYAAELNLKKVDLKKLFEMPNQEVRYRFFRSDPQYDLNKPIKPGTITKRHGAIITAEREESGLETALKFIGTIGIFALFALSINLNNLTGYAINIKKNQINLDFLIFILLIVLLVLAILNKFKSKKRL
ncbi:hypothetical protein J4429_03735 [Candidatus Pacearchaeota archaeon]|nr:hypothetical protein [Candidatus Pacearchaeota archaeon]